MFITRRKGTTSLTFIVASRSRRENRLSRQILIRNIPDLGRSSVSLFVKIGQIAVDLIFRAVELEVVAALRVGDRRNVIDDRFPIEAFAPLYPLETNLQAGSGLNQ